MRALSEHTALGSGFQIAMRDLEIRGAGDLLGGEQSGFINEIGFDTYQKILKEAIEELKEEHFQELYPDRHWHLQRGANRYRFGNPFFLTTTSTMYRKG